MNRYRLLTPRRRLLLKAAAAAALIACGLLPNAASAQVAATDTIYNPDIIYSPIPKQYVIAGIKVEGLEDADDYLIIGFSGLSEGEKIEIPGDAITSATKRLWRQGLYSNVQIRAEKIAGDKIWLVIHLEGQPRMSELRFSGTKGNEKKDLNTKLGMVAGQQITPNILDRAKGIVEKYYADKGFQNAKVLVTKIPDLTKKDNVIVNIDVERSSKVKVHKIYIDGNDVLSDRRVKNTMKKTNENADILNIFKQKKFVESDYRDDKERIIQKYNELGYRDARIVKDSVVTYSPDRVDVYLTVEEGPRYYISSIDWVGNTVYDTQVLNQVLGMKKGDVYNQKLLDKRANGDDDAVASLYTDRGYLFFQLVPIEENIKGDSIALQMRVMEGPQAKVNRIVINGNDRLYEKVIRRELRVRPGELFSKNDLVRSVREIAQTGHFNPENMDVHPEPNEGDGTVDIVFNLESKANDKIQLSLGWGQSGITGQVALSFTNFSIKNLFRPSTYRGLIPQGDGQTFSISAQTNARYYQSYSISFMDPWFGGRRPTTLMVSLDYSRSTGINSSFYNDQWSNAYMNSLWTQGITGSSYPYNNVSYESAYDPNKVIQLAGATVGWGTRLTWPDDYFTFRADLDYRWYYLRNWEYLSYMQNGTSNSLGVTLTLQRSSIDNPLYTRRGSTFSVALSATPPVSLFKKRDWKALYYEATLNSSERAQQQMYRWIEYWKLSFKSRTYTPLTDPDGKHTLVLMTRADFGLLGSYNRWLKTPFETYYFGGDGMTGGYTYAQETIGMRGYDNGQFTPRRYDGYAYGRFTMELHFPFVLQSATTIYALAFAEAGNAWTSVRDFAPFNLARSAGVGVRVYLSVIGFLGIDWGYGFDRVWGQRGGSHFHFVLGQEF